MTTQKSYKFQRIILVYQCTRYEQFLVVFSLHRNVVIQLSALDMTKDISIIQIQDTSKNLKFPVNKNKFWKKSMFAFNWYKSVLYHFFYLYNVSTYLL